MSELNIEELKQEAKDLGITFSGQIGAEKLKEKIENFYEAREQAAAKELAGLTEKVEKESKDVKGVKGVKSKEQALMDKRFKREAAAKKTRVVMITDNDQRVNNHTTTCTVTCASEYFSLGTRVLPLNEKIEVAQGHIKVLQSVEIPLHVRDPKTGLSATRMRKRYSISFED